MEWRFGAWIKAERVALAAFAQVVNEILEIQRELVPVVAKARDQLLQPLAEALVENRVLLAVFVDMVAGGVLHLGGGVAARPLGGDVLLKLGIHDRERRDLRVDPERDDVL